MTTADFSMIFLTIVVIIIGALWAYRDNLSDTGTKTPPPKSANEVKKQLMPPTHELTKTVLSPASMEPPRMPKPKEELPITLYKPKPKTEVTQTYEELISEMIDPGIAKAASMPAAPLMPDTVLKSHESEDEPAPPPVLQQFLYASQPQGNILHRIHEQFIMHDTFITLIIDPADPMRAQLRFTEDVDTRILILRQPEIYHYICVVPDKNFPSSMLDIEQTYGEAAKEESYWIIQKKIALSWK